MTNEIQGRKLLVEIQCVGNFNFWMRSIKAKHLLFEQYEHYQKTGFRNRFQVLGSHGPITLSVPLKGGRNIRQMIRDVRIDNSGNWQKNHWKTLESCYNKSAFFFHYKDSLAAEYLKPYVHLWDFDLTLMNWIVKQVGWNLCMEFTGSYEKVPHSNIQDLRGILKNEKDNFQQVPYFQVFGQHFYPNLSLLDVLFNLGPETMAYFHQQATI